MKALIIPAILSTYRSLQDRTLKITFETNELSPDHVSSIQTNLLKPGFLAFQGDPFKQDEIDYLGSIKSDLDEPGKTKAQRLRAVFFRMWQQKPEGYDNPEDHYNVKMEKLIAHFKKELE